MGLRSSIGANEQFVRNIQDAHGLDGLDRVRAGLDHAATSSARTTCCCRAPPTPPTPPSRKALATEIDADHRGHQAERRTPATAASTSCPARRIGRRRTSSAPTTPTRATRPAWTRRSPGIVREIGPGVTMTINTVARRDPRRRPDRPDRRQAAATRCATSSTTSRPTTAPRCATTTRPLQGHVDKLLERPRPQRRADQPPRGGDDPPRPDQPARSRTQLSNTEDADIAKTMIDFNSQSAAYQAALRPARTSCSPRSWISSAEPIGPLVRSLPPPGDPLPHVHRHHRLFALRHARDRVRGRHRVPERADRPRRPPLRARRQRRRRGVQLAALDRRPVAGAAGRQPVGVLRRLRGRPVRRGRRADHGRPGRRRRLGDGSRRRRARRTSTPTCARRS